METIILIIHMLVAVALLGLILLQQGKGADMGTAFGSGASSTVFGSRGSSSFLTRSTAILAFIFLLTSLSLGYFSNQAVAQKSVTEMPLGNATDEPPLPKDAATVEDSSQTQNSADDIPRLPQEGDQPAAATNDLPTTPSGDGDDPDTGTTEPQDSGAAEQPPRNE